MFSLSFFEDDWSNSPLKGPVSELPALSNQIKQSNLPFTGCSYDTLFVAMVV